MAITLFHTTDRAEEILKVGFVDGDGTYGLGAGGLVGVFLSAAPANVNDGAKGEDVLAVTFPAPVVLDEFAIVEDGHPAWEWCVPAVLINSSARVRQLTQEEIDSLAGSWPE